MPAPRVALVLLLVPLVPLASAGTAEAPEIVDPAGDCAFAPGNHYMDIVSAWVSDETATDLKVNIQLAEWVEPVAHGAGFTVQFTHQGVQFGVLAAYVGSWTYGNGRIAGRQIEGWNDTEGSFQASPPVLTILFQKSNFPHDDPTDNRLVGFTGGSIDLKPMVPTFFAPPLPAYPPAIDCDVVASDVEYVFQSGGHSMHDPSAGATDATTPTPTEEPAAGDDAIAPAAAPTQEPAQGVPGPGLPGLVSALLGVTLLRRSRRR